MLIELLTETNAIVSFSKLVNDAEIIQDGESITRGENHNDKTKNQSA